MSAESTRGEPPDVILERVIGQMNADILGPRPRQLPKSWPDDLELVRSRLRTQREKLEKVRDELARLADGIAGSTWGDNPIKRIPKDTLMHDAVRIRKQVAALDSILKE